MRSIIIIIILFSTVLLKRNPAWKYDNLSAVFVVFKTLR